MSPDISIIMGVCNENKKQIDNSISSILNQTFKDFEFIIILDNPKNIQAKKQIKNIKDKRIRLHENKENIGLTKTLNKAIKLSEGKYIARMDADDIAHKDRLKEQYSMLQENKNIDLCFTWVKYYDDKRELVKNHNPKNSLCKNLKRNFFRGHIFVHPTLFCRREILDKNKYNEKYKNAQDFELWLRLIAKDYEFAIVEKYLMDYFLERRSNLAKRIANNIKKNKYGIIALFKNYPSYYLRLGFYTFLVSLIIRTTILVIIEPFSKLKK